MNENLLAEIEEALDHTMGDVKGQARRMMKLVEKYREEIADEVLAERKERYERSYDIACPECGTPPGAYCMNFGSAGGPMNHMARIEAVPEWLQNG